MKKILLIMGIALILFSACDKTGGGGDPRKGTLEVWSFTDEVGTMVNDYYASAYPEVTVNYTMTPTDQFPAKLDPVLASGQGAPDVFALESDFVRKYVESGLLLDLTDLYEANKSKLLAYPVEIGSFNGKVYAMSWQACPGAMFYRRSIAKKYLGTDDPVEVQKYFTDLNKFQETAKLLKDSSRGSCVVVSALGDLAKVFYGMRAQPWIVGGKLNIDPIMGDYLDLAKTLHDNRWEGRVGQWSEGWFAGMNGTLRDENGAAVEVFSYFLPTWGLHYVLKTNAPDTAGDWAMIPGPAGWRWGGTWIGAYKGTKNAAAAKELIRYLTIDDGFLESWAKDTGDMVSNLNVVNKIKDNYSEPFLGGQNHYAEFAEMAKAVDGKLVQASDMVLDNLFQENVTAFVNGEKSKQQALDDFKSQAENQLGL